MAGWTEGIAGLVEKWVFAEARINERFVQPIRTMNAANGHPYDVLDSIAIHSVDFGDFHRIELRISIETEVIAEDGALVRLQPVQRGVDQSPKFAVGNMGDRVAIYRIVQA